MKQLPFYFAIIFFLMSCKDNSSKNSENKKNIESVMKTDVVDYQLPEKSFKGFVAQLSDQDNLQPIVLIIPEWWGANDYARSRAKKVAELGYTAFVVDIYGDAKVVETPDEAGKLATPFYDNPKLAKDYFEAALKKAKNLKGVDSTKIAVIGYCFGGAMALNMARQIPTLKGAVSFHGNLMTGVKPNNNKVPMLILNGEADTFVPQKEINDFKKEMDSAKINYQFINYPRAIHSFTNPNSTAVGEKYNIKVAYNKDADEKSWEQLKLFLTKIFN